MRLSRIVIDNFRNFRHLDVRLDQHAVIVGENKIGKSNLLYALRLVLDPTLPDGARMLRDEDFWDGLPRPLGSDQQIAISVELSEFEDNADQLAVLAEHLVEPEPMVARLTYVFQARTDVGAEKLRGTDYEFFVYGGDRLENEVGFDVRRRIPLDVLAALRDAEGDLANWRRSPLRPLLDAVAARVDRDTLKTIADKVSDATKEVAETPEVSELAGDITARLKEMVGVGHAMDAAFGFSPTEPDRLVRALRLFIDGGRRGINEASLGSANLLYLTLKCLELEQLVVGRERSHTFLAIEEPEAHIHPHLQRLVYREFLRMRTQQVQAGKETRRGEGSTTILLTTHSPHIVSVAPLRSIVLLRRTEDGGSTEGVSSSGIELGEKDEKDIERYLDVTRGEMLFAKGILLVEGDAEVFVVPTLARLNDVDFDQLGITVCSVSGTNFAPYLKLLGPEGLNIPVAVLTDADPDGKTPTPGQRRVRTLLGAMGMEAALKGKTEKEVLRIGQESGLFVNGHTFEVDLFKAGRHRSICATIVELTDNSAAKVRANGWRESPGTLDAEQMLKDIEAIGKGRFAQRLATRLGGRLWPEYIKDGVEYVAGRCR